MKNKKGVYNTNFIIWFVVFIIIILTCLYFASARECLDRVQPNTLCRVTTPAGYDCSETYDLINISDGEALTAKGSLEALNSSLGLCYFNFTWGTGDYKIVLNEDNTSRVIVVDDVTVDDIKNDTEEILERIGDPTTNSTSLWNYFYIPDRNSCTDADFSGIARLWCFVWRTIHAIEP